MSLVELPILTSQSVAGVKTAETQVRIILRDISGKFCWESTALYNSEDSTMSNDDGSIELPEWPPTEAYENTQPKSFSQVQALRYVLCTRFCFWCYTESALKHEKSAIFRRRQKMQKWIWFALVLLLSQLFLRSKSEHEFKWFSAKKQGTGLRKNWL